MTETARANGHARPVTPVLLPARGPLSGWPQPDDPGESRTPADVPERDDRSGPERLRAAWDRHRAKVLKGIAAAVLLSTAASFYESFSGLVGWFERLGFRGFRAYAAPAMVDLVGLAGEAIALVVIIEGRPGKVVRVLAWGAFSWGLVLSVVGNAGRDGFRPGAGGLFDMAWFAVPPLSLAIITSAALALAKLLLKPAPEVAPESPVQVTPEPAPGHPQVTRQVTPRRKPQVTPGRVSDADLKDQIRAAVDADPAVTLKALAADLGRGRDRLRPLLDEVRREGR